jgi:hypothetical protein
MPGPAHTRVRRVSVCCDWRPVLLCAWRAPVDTLHRVGPALRRSYSEVLQQLDRQYKYAHLSHTHTDQNDGPSFPPRCIDRQVAPHAHTRVRTRPLCLFGVGDAQRHPGDAGYAGRLYRIARPRSYLPIHIHTRIQGHGTGLQARAAWLTREGCAAGALSGEGEDDGDAVPVPLPSAAARPAAAAPTATATTGGSLEEILRRVLPVIRGKYVVPKLALMAVH